MNTPLASKAQSQRFLTEIAGLDSPEGSDRVKRIVHRIVGDLFKTIDDFNVTNEEFWTAVNFLATGAPEFGLWAAGLGFEHYLDVRMDLADSEAGLEGGTPRTIEGPLYVKGAPRTKGFARLDDGSDEREPLVMRGRVLNLNGEPIAGALVDVWHANALGNYSYFDPSQSAFNLRRQIETGEDGVYQLRTIVPSGYSVPPGGSTEQLLQQLGRHGHRPAHIHFFVSAPGYCHLTTQINIDGDPYLHDDFAYATRDELIPKVVWRDAAEDIREAGLNTSFAEIEFDFTLRPAEAAALSDPSKRPRVSHPA